MRITLDTSVLFQALYSAEGASFQILKLFRGKKLDVSISIPVYEECGAVLLRRENLALFGLGRSDVVAVLDYFALEAVLTDVRFLMRPNLRDEDDNMFVDLAFASGSRYLITRNIRDFTVESDLRLDSFEVITPSDFLKKWRDIHG